MFPIIFRLYWMLGEGCTRCGRGILCGRAPRDLATSKVFWGTKKFLDNLFLEINLLKVAFFNSSVFVFFKKVEGGRGLNPSLPPGTSMPSTYTDVLNCKKPRLFYYYYLPFLSSIHEKANCIAMFWTVSPHSLGSCHFRVTCLSHKGGASR